MARNLNRRQFISLYPFALITFVIMLALLLACSPSDPITRFHNGEIQIISKEKAPELTTGSTTPTQSGAISEIPGDFPPPIVNPPIPSNPYPDLITCSTRLGIDSSKIKAIGHGQTITITPESSVMVKVSGSLGNVLIDVKSPEGKPVDGVCVFVSGNQNKVNLVISTKLQKLDLVARGNMNKLHVNTTASGNLTSDFHASLSGNQSSLLVDGTSGRYVCPITELHGHGPSMHCL